MSLQMIGLSGWARSGKDTVADYLVQKHGFVKISFADQMRTALYNLNPNIDLGGYKISLRVAVDMMGWEELKSQSDDLRGLMQRMGTDVGRQMWGDDFWVNAAMKNLNGKQKYVFSDVRYPNEADAIYEGGGEVWRIVREGVGPANNHTSETALNQYPFDRHLFNNAGIDDIWVFIENLLDN